MVDERRTQDVDEAGARGVHGLSRHCSNSLCFTLSPGLMPSAFATARR